MIAVLRADSTYFAADWRLKDTFQVKTAEGVARTKRQRDIMRAHPDLVGKLMVMRDSNNRPRVGVVKAVHELGFEAVVLGTKGRTFPGDALLWVIGTWAGPSEGAALNTALNRMVQEAKGLQDTLLPFERRQMLVERGQAVNPVMLAREVLGTDDVPDVAVLAVALTLAGDGAVREGQGLIPKRAFSGEPLEQNARQVALEAFPPEARLRKVGMEIHRKRLTLTFDFPYAPPRNTASRLKRSVNRQGGR